jgi:Reverse transcriptase (RNA-dependent DNA polymerase)
VGEAVEEEHERMAKFKVWKPDKKDLPRGAIVLSTTWVMKKKANGKFHAKLNARGYKQIDGIHNDKDTKSSPGVNETTILVVFVLMLLAGWNATIVNVNGAFLNGKFKDRQKMYVEAAQGFENIMRKELYCYCSVPCMEQGRQRFSFGALQLLQ